MAFFGGDCDRGCLPAIKHPVIFVDMRPFKVLSVILPAVSRGVFCKRVLINLGMYVKNCLDIQYTFFHLYREKISSYQKLRSHGDIGRFARFEVKRTHGWARSIRRRGGFSDLIASGNGSQVLSRKEEYQ